jgi:hypothetical protein
LIENHQDLATIFTLLRTDGSRESSVMRLLNVHLNPNNLAESDAVIAWVAMVRNTLVYLSEFNGLWKSLNLPLEKLYESQSIPEMVPIFVHMYSIDSLLYKNVNFVLRHIPVEVAGKIVKELRGLLSYIYLLQSSIHYLAMQQPLEKEMVVYRGIKDTVTGLDNLYHSVVGRNILWRSFTSVSRSVTVALERFISQNNGMLFEIHLQAGSVVADIHDYARYPSELEMLIAAYTTFRVDEVVNFRIRDKFPEFKWDIVIPRVKLTYASSWFDFAFDC